MAQDRYKYFRIEARELLDELGSAVLSLEKSANAGDHVPKVLRLAHTLKGAARVVKQPDIADRAHVIEDLLSAFRDSPTAVPRDQIESVLACLDRIGAQLKALDAPAEAKPAQSARAVRPDEGESFETVRTGISDVEALLEDISETHAQVISIRKAMSGAERARTLADMLVEQLAPRLGREQSSLSDERARSLAAELRGVFTGFERGLTQAVEQMDRELTGVRDKAERLRLVPAAALFGVLERTARDTAQSLGKQATFEARGGAIRLDAHVVQGVQKAMIQLVRNAVAHGLEPEKERAASGKVAFGLVTIEVVRSGRRVLFRCSDDGRGVDVQAVRRAAAERSSSSCAELELLDMDELFQMLLRGGISTSKGVTELSGRGIGLDVVRESAQRLKGAVSLRTAPGRGSTFELSVPISAASIEALVVVASGIRAWIPLDAVQRTTLIAASDISRTPNGSSIVHLGKAIPFVELATILRAPAATRAERTHCAMIIEASSGIAALGVDELRGTTQAVLRPLPELAPAEGVIAGATLDAEGNPELVLDPDGLVLEAYRERVSNAQAEAAPPFVLVIDDSLTTRMLEQSILESAGYRVDVATSAEQALDKAREDRYSLFLVDVEMPGMDGFTFIEHVRKDPALCQIPAILVTSRASPEDRERGRKVGANGYVVKSEFDQVELLSRIKRLVA